MKKNSSLPQIAKTLKSHPFMPSRLLSNHYGQMAAFLVTPYFICPHSPSVKRVVKLPNGEQLEAECWFYPDKENRSTIVVLNGLDGYTGRGTAKFGKGVGHKAYHAGFNVIFLKQRGEGSSIHQTKAFGDFFGEDLPDAFKVMSGWVSQRIYIVGLSSGGWAALLALGRLQNHMVKNIAGVVAISAPCNTLEVWQHTDKKRFFGNLLLQRYKHLIRRRIAIDPPGTWDENQLKQIKTKRQFFDTYKLIFGYPEKFTTLEEYFAKTDVFPFLINLKIPTLIIHAVDDPVVPAEPFMRPALQKNKHVVTLLSKYGSHGCFIADKKNWSDVDRHWAQNRAIEFINLLEKQNN